MPHGTVVPNWNSEPKSFRLDGFCWVVPVVPVGTSQTPPREKKLFQKRTQMGTRDLTMPWDAAAGRGSGSMVLAGLTNPFRSYRNIGAYIRQYGTVYWVSPGSEMTPWGRHSLWDHFDFYICSLLPTPKMRPHRFKGQPQNHLTAHAAPVMGSSTGR